VNDQPQAGYAVIPQFVAAGFGLGGGGRRFGQIRAHRVCLLRDGQVAENRPKPSVSSSGTKRLKRQQTIENTKISCRLVTL
jgi:hypothetical protein